PPLPWRYGDDRPEMAPMIRTAVLCSCAILCGCQAIPLGSTPTPPQPPTVCLFERAVADRDPIKQAVLRPLPPGTPMGQAQAALEREEFACHPDITANPFFGTADPIPRGVYLPGEARERLRRERDGPLIYCSGTR